MKTQNSSSRSFRQTGRWLLQARDVIRVRANGESRMVNREWRHLDTITLRNYSGRRRISFCVCIAESEVFGMSEQGRMHRM